MAVYTKHCETFSDAMNSILFELRVPEYYDPLIPAYFKEPRKPDPPVVNGEMVTWEEYYQKYPDRKNDMPKTFTPLPIFKSMDDDMATAKFPIVGIIDLCENSVPFEFVKYSDLEWVVQIMDGYRSEISRFTGRDRELDLFLARMDRARKTISDINEMNKRMLRNLYPNMHKGPMSLADILRSLI